MAKDQQKWSMIIDVILIPQWEFGAWERIAGREGISNNFGCHSLKSMDQSLDAWLTDLDVAVIVQILLHSFFESDEGLFAVLMIQMNLHTPIDLPRV